MCVEKRLPQSSLLFSLPNSQEHKGGRKKRIYAEEVRENEERSLVNTMSGQLFTFSRQFSKILNLERWLPHGTQNMKKLRVRRASADVCEPEMDLA